MVELDYVALGISSLVGDKHVVMVDIDEGTFLHAVGVAEELILDNEFSDFFVLRSSGKGWHLLCLDKVDFEEAYEAVLPFADEGWMEMSKRRGEFVLRCSSKVCSNGNPKGRMHFIGIIKSPYLNREKSYAHVLALRKFFGAKVPLKGNFDLNGISKMVCYSMKKPLASQNESNLAEMASSS